MRNASTAPAGGVDITARIVGAELQKRIGQTIVIESKPGATGTIGAGYVAKVKPDGYTVLITSNPAITMLPFMTKVSYDPQTDFIPVTKVGIAPTIVVVPADSPYRTLKEFVDASKKPDSKINIGVTGLGSSPDIEFALINKMTDAKISIMSYRGATFIVNDVLGSQITAGSAAVPAMATQIWAGRMKPLAVVSKTRSSIFPDVPTVKETMGLNIDGFPTWYGFFVPAGTPKEIVKRLETEILAIMKDPAVVEKMKQIGTEVLLTGSETFAAENQVEIDALKRALKETNVSIK